MPTVSRWLIKTALGYLVIALGMALVRSLQGVGVLPGQPAVLWLPQLHLLTVGWLTQLIFGVAYWLFPRPRSGNRGVVVVWGAYVLLNVGLPLRLMSESGVLPVDVRSWGLISSAGLQWIASLLLVGAFWQRVRTK